MIIHSIDPVFFSIFSIDVRFYGLAYVLGFLFAYLALRFLVSKDKLPGMDLKKVDDLMVYLILGVIIGARLFTFIFYHPSVFWTDPLEVLMIWHGGMSFHGGLIGAAVVGYFFSKKHKISFLSLADIVVIPAALALFFGRIANFINAEHFGFVTNVPWCVNFNAETNAGELVCRHPSQLYEALKNLLIFISLLFISLKNTYKKGFIFWLFILFYGFLRFVTNIWRADPPLFWGISTGQLLSAVMFVVALVVIITNYGFKGKD